MKSVGIDTEKIDERITDYYPEIRNILYDYLTEYGEIDPVRVGDKSVIGEWKFVPESKVKKAIERDMKLLFNR